LNLNVAVSCSRFTLAISKPRTRRNGATSSRVVRAYGVFWCREFSAAFIAPFLPISSHDFICITVATSPVGTDEAAQALFVSAFRRVLELIEQVWQGRVAGPPTASRSDHVQMLGSIFGRTTDLFQVRGPRSGSIRAFALARNG